MVSNLIITIGWFGLAFALAYFVAYDRFGGVTSVDYIRHSRDILLVSGFLVLAGYILKYLGSAIGVGAGRCKKCGKRIEKQEMYCFNHRIEAIREAQDQARIFEKRK